MNHLKRYPFHLIPALDLKNGHCTRIPRNSSLNPSDPCSVAQYLVTNGAQYLHLVDLDAALDPTEVDTQLRLLGQMVHTVPVPVEISAGVTTIPQLDAIAALNPWQIILSSRAVFDQPFLEQALRRIPPDQLTIALDTAEGMVAARGWKQTSHLPVLETAQSLAKMGFKRIIVTEVNRDGRMQGSDHQTALQVKKTVMKQYPEVSVLVSGGVQSDDEITTIFQSGLDGVIVGRGLYEGKISLTPPTHQAEPPSR